jgi:hypothetical protein
MLDLFDFIKKKSINQSKSHEKDRKIGDRFLLMYKCGINSDSNFSMSLLYFNPTQINGL